MNTPTEPKELTFMEDFVANAEPGSEFAVFICTWLGLIIGTILSTNIEGFSKEKIIIFTLCVIIGCCIGFIVKKMIDKSQLAPDNIFDECDLR